MTIGRVYGAVNAGFPHHVKVGATLQTARKRVSQLKGHYGTKHEFVEKISFLCANPFRVEALAHRRLESKHRREFGTELFRCTVAEAEEAILWAIDEALKYPAMPPPQRMQWQRRGTRRSSHQQMPWTILTVCVFIGIAIWIARAKPELPDWLPDPVLRTAILIESRQ